jgi:hypothetical protein
MEQARKRLFQIPNEGATMKKVFIVNIEDTKLVQRSDLLDWLCSSEVQRGRSTDRYWIVRTDTMIHNTYMDMDVNYLINMLQRTQVDGYESLMIMKANVNNNRSDSSSGKFEGEFGSGEVQQTDSPKTGEVPHGESNSEVLASSSHSGDSESGQSES